MGLGPGGQPISASQLNIGGVMGNLGPSGEYFNFLISFSLIRLLDHKAHIYSFVIMFKGLYFIVGYLGHHFSLKEE